MQATVDEPYWGKSWLGKRKRGQVTLGKGGEPVRIGNGTSKQTRIVGRRRIRGKESQTASKEHCSGKSRLGKRKRADGGHMQAWESRRSGRKIYQTDNYVARGRK